MRQAVELGADILKVDPTDDLNEYPNVIQAALGRPLLLRGGGKISEEEMFRRCISVLNSGARGLVFGRNIIQHKNPAGMTRVLTVYAFLCCYLHLTICVTAGFYEYCSRQRCKCRKSYEHTCGKHANGSGAVNTVFSFTVLLL